MSTQVKFTVVVMRLNLPFSFGKDELLLILNLSRLHLHELICLPVSQTSKHNKVTFYFLNELRRPRSEDTNWATLRQSNCKLGTPGCKTRMGLESRSPWYPQDKWWSMAVNFPWSQRNSYAVMSLLWWNLSTHLLPCLSSAGCATLITKSSSLVSTDFDFPETVLHQLYLSPSVVSRGEDANVFIFLLILTISSKRNPHNQDVHL